MFIHYYQGTRTGELPVLYHMWVPIRVEAWSAPDRDRMIRFYANVMEVDIHRVFTAKF